MTSSEYLFVYGTLRRGSGHPMQALLSRRTRWLGPAVLRGSLFRVGAYPAIVASLRPRERVRGDVYVLDASARLLARLDAYEGCDAAARPPQEYRRERLPVRLLGGRRLEAWVYLYNRPLRGLRRLRSGDFFASRSQSGGFHES